MIFKKITSSHRRCFVRKGVLRNFAKIHRENTCARVCGFYEIPKKTFFTEHLCTNASEGVITETMAETVINI